MSEKNLKRITKGYEYVIMVFMMILGWSLLPILP
ncbi:Uncharacterised protein [Weissella viridescens]|uniref:Uncharacterized protein n=1 Tax=Weissella viridescens TaxID=1629 RepID=A0A380NW78_WEIVI|nr:Uncharacterised protein [Weissella viridescens]